MSSQWKKRLSKFYQSWTGSIILAFLIAMTFKSMIVDWNVVPTGSMNPTILAGDRIFVNKLAFDLKVPFWPFSRKPYKTIQLIRWGEPKRGDIVVFFSPASGTRLIKRVVGLPGDVVILENNLLTINGKVLTYENSPSSLYNDLNHIEQSVHDFYMENLETAKHAIMIKNTEKLLELCSNIHSEEELIRFYPSAKDQKAFLDLCRSGNDQGRYYFQIPKNSYVMIGDNRTNSADARYFGLVNRRQIVGRAVAIVISCEGSIFKAHFRWHRFFKKLT